MERLRPLQTLCAMQGGPHTRGGKSCRMLGFVVIAEINSTPHIAGCLVVFFARLVSSLFDFHGHCGSDLDFDLDLLAQLIS